MGAQWDKSLLLIKKSCLLLLFFCGFLIRSLSAQTIVHAQDYGIRPNTGKDVTKAIQHLIDACKSKHTPIQLVFEKGQYDLYFNATSSAPYYITNTSAKDECPSKIKHIGIWLKDMNSFTLNGNGALFMLHGKMTSLIADNCKNLTLKNIQFDYQRPTMSEFTVMTINDAYVDVKVNPSSWYHIKDSMLYWYGENWDGEKMPLRLHTCVYCPEDSAMHFVNAAWQKLTKSKQVVELAKNVVRFYHPVKMNIKVGDVFTMRDITRDEVGMHFVHCSNILLDSVQMHFMHGLGIVSQFCTNIHFNHLVCAPRPQTDRICSSTADMAHFSTCRGWIKVENSFFSGGQDDFINIHSAHLRIMQQLPGNKIIVRFMHPQTYGIQMYEKGDTIDFINHNSLLAFATRVVKDYRKLNEYDIELTLTQPVPTKIGTDDCIENVTRTPSVLIRNNWFQRTPTRGLLITTRRKVIIENNTWFKTGMSAILISDDANSWFESGMVKDVTIRNNRFVKCGYSDGAGVITIYPENTIFPKGAYVHKNILIQNNFFDLVKPLVLVAKSTENLRFITNKIVENGFLNRQQNVASLEDCEKVVIQNNYIVGGTRVPAIELSKMKGSDLHTDWRWNK